jgi:hypothetical protein
MYATANIATNETRVPIGFSGITRAQLSFFLILARATHVNGFFIVLRIEIVFYLFHELF